MLERGIGRLAAAIMLVVLLVGCSTTGGPTSRPTERSARPTTAAAERPTTAAERPTATPGAPAASEPGFAPSGRTESAVVLSITDGDTIRIDRGYGSERVRYIGVNTPEVEDPFGSAATAANARMVEGREVVLERDVSEVDRFGRLLRYVWLRDGDDWLLVNLALAEQGFAQVATYPPDVRYVERFVAAQAAARSAGAGLWAEAADVPTILPLVPTIPPRVPPAATAKPAASPPAAGCHPSYDPCLPIEADLDCPDVRALGLAPVRVLGSDPYRLDGNHDGVGCE